MCALVDSYNRTICLLKTILTEWEVMKIYRGLVQ